jgi:sugar/nucleoside kinase (ribokinase family)
MQYLCGKVLMMRKILGIGNALIDVLVTLDDDSLLEQLKLPKGSMQLIDEGKLKEINRLFEKMNRHLATGGSAGNTILALASLEIESGFIGKVGDDKFGNFYRDNLHKNRIEDKLLTTLVPSGVASTFISPDGERTFGTFLGAASLLKREDLTPEMFSGYHYLYIEGYLVQDREMITRAAELARAAGSKVCLDMASYNVVEENRDFFRSFIHDYVDIAFANEVEAASLTGQSPWEALREIASLCDIAVIKIGSGGSLVRSEDKEYHVPSQQVEHVIDTTGAGDFYAAGFLYGLTKGCPLYTCAEIGSLLAKQVIQVIGTTLPQATWDEIKLDIKSIIR